MAHPGDNGARRAADMREENINLRAVLRTIRQPFLVLDGALNVERANAAFHATFGTGDAETEARKVYELGNGQWNIPELRRLLEVILPDNGEVSDFRVEHTFERIGRRVMVLNGYRMERGEGADRILLTIEDRTEREALQWELEAQREYAEKIVDASRNPLLVLDRDLRVMTANETFCRDFRVEPSETEGQLVYNLGNGQWDIPRLRELLENVLPNNAVFDDFEVEHAFDEIGPRTMVLNARKIDHKEWILLEIEDVTESRRAGAERRFREKRQAFVLQLTDELRPLSDVSEITGVATRLLGEWLGASRAYFVEWPPGADYGEVAHDYAATGLPSLTGRYPVAVFRSAHDRLTTTRTWIVPDAGADTEMAAAERDYYLRTGVVAWVDVPLIKEGELHAALCVVQDGRRKWTDAEIALIEETAERCWAAIERGRAEAQLEEVRERYDHIIAEASDYAIFTMDTGGKITSWPSGAAQVFGWTEEEMVGADFSKTFVAEDVDAGEVKRELAVAVRDGSAANIRWHCRKDGARIFIDGTTVRLGPAEAAKGFIKIGQDITGRRRSEERLRESEARLQAIFADAAVGLSEIDASGRVLRANAELCRILGRTRDDVVGVSIAEVTHPEDLPQSLEMVGRVLRGEADGAGSGLDKRYIRPNGSEIWANSRASLLPGTDEAPGTLLVVTVDLTERREAEAAVRESDARFRQFGEASSDALWIRDAQTLRWEYLSPAFDRIYGTTREAALARPDIGFLIDLVLPEDRDPTREAIAALRSGAGTYAYRIRRPSDGEVRWLRTTGFPLVDTDGSVRSLGGITHDMTDEKRTADRMEVLVSELQHRTRNLIGVTRALASRTLRSSVSLEDFAGRFGARLDALARVNGLLSRLDEGDRIAFDELLETELSGHGIAPGQDGAEKVTLSGPRGVLLPSASVQTLALALHELLTNATKYGALSAREGRLSIAWELMEGDVRRLRLAWKEIGITVKVDNSAPAGNGGYGRQLIERALPFQLGAETTYDLGPDGLRCTIVLPLPR